MDNGLNQTTDDLDLDELKKLLESGPGGFLSPIPEATPASPTPEQEDSAPKAEYPQEDTPQTPAETSDADEVPELLTDPPQKPEAADQQPEEGGEEEKKEQKGTSSGILMYLHDIAYLLAAIMLVFMMVFRVVVVSGPSMRYTLLDGDYLLLLGSAFYNEPQQGDIVVVCKESFQDGLPIVKRVIAVGGQEVDIDFAEGIVYVDGVALDEPYTATPTNLSQGVQFPLTVDEGCIFVMGDNRNDSRDSRYPQIGIVDNREILGKAILLFLPGTDGDKVERDFSRIGGIS